MFTQLKSLLRKGDSVTVTIAIENETQSEAGVRLRVNVFPRLFTTDGENGPNRLALNQPLSIVDTPENLDSPQFLETLTKFTDSTITCRNSLEEVEAAHKKAAEEARKKPASKSKITPTTKTPSQTEKTTPDTPEKEENKEGDDRNESLGL